MTSCQTPSNQVALLDAARAGAMPDPELFAHLEDCDDCRAAIERLRRMVSVWVAEHDREDERAIVAAAARFEQRAGRPKPSSWQGAVPFAFAGAVAATALLFATLRARPVVSSVASGANSHVESPTTMPATPVGETPFGPATPSVVAGPHVRGPRGVARLADGLRVALRAGETATVQLDGGKSSELRGPCVVEFWSSASDVGGWRLSPLEPATSGVLLDDPTPADSTTDRATTGDPAPTRSGDGTSGENAKVAPPRPAKVETPERGAATSREEAAATEHLADTRGAGGDVFPTVSGDPKVERAWARAAEALRRDDFETADGAFADLGRSSDAATRDAARLARAQLWMAHGRGAAVRPVLVELASKGATALVRQRAAEFLAPQSP